MGGNTCRKKLILRLISQRLANSLRFVNYPKKTKNKFLWWWMPCWEILKPNRRIH